ncbi:MAG TPA: FTR1 family protein [Gaiellales bacterium]|nr:FTR1 family protein [Gaiellales bacterium]
MLGSLFITLREGFEAALMVGIVLAYLRQSGASDRARHVWAGVGVAALASVAMGGVIFAAGGELKGSSEKLYEATAMLLAAGVLTWMIFWMQRQARGLGGALRQRVSDALVMGGGALFWLAFVSVGREGFETSLFMYAATGTASPASTLAGGVIGLAVAVVLGVLVYKGAAHLNLGTFFKVTSVLVLAFAAYLIASAMHELGELAGNDALESGAYLIALLYVVGAVWAYLRPPAVLARALGE